MYLDRLEFFTLVAVASAMFFITYWQGFNSGKREGYREGRNIMRHLNSK